MGRLAPVIGEWYQNIELSELFEVVAIDDLSGTLAIQYVDGEISELDVESWHRTAFRTAAPPEDWTSPYEIEHVEDDDDVIDWNAIRDPLNQIEADSLLDFEEPI